MKYGDSTPRPLSRHAPQLDAVRRTAVGRTALFFSFLLFLFFSFLPNNWQRPTGRVSHRHASDWDSLSPFSFSFSFLFLFFSLLFYSLINNIILFLFFFSFLFPFSFLGQWPRGYQVRERPTGPPSPDTLSPLSLSTFSLSTFSL